MQQEQRHQPWRESTDAYSNADLRPAAGGEIHALYFLHLRIDQLPRYSDTAFHLPATPSGKLRAIVIFLSFSSFFLLPKHRDKHPGQLILHSRSTNYHHGKVYSHRPILERLPTSQSLLPSESLLLQPVIIRSVNYTILATIPLHLSRLFRLLVRILGSTPSGCIFELLTTPGAAYHVVANLRRRRRRRLPSWSTCR